MNQGLSTRQINEVALWVSEHQDEIIHAWHTHC